jgi:hypothetical protein
MLFSIVAWRKMSFPEYKCIFPLMKMDYGALQSKLFSDESISSIRISHVRDDIKGVLNVGDVFDVELVGKLASKGIDTMGEDGSFHTEVILSP